jgi:hypothetical protein
MQIPTSAGMLANSVLPVTPTQSGLLSPVGETVGSASFAPIEAVSSTRLSREVPEQRPQPNFAPENSGRADIAPVANSVGASSADVNGSQGAEQQEAQNQTSTAEEQGDSSQDSASQKDDQAQREADQIQQRQEQQQKQDLDIIRQLSQRDNEVRAHEQAHSSVGGQYAGSAQYSYQRGPDGVNYAVGGEVPIDTGVINGDPRATLEKMQIVQRAALAPAEPSSQDRRVAALASQQASQARAEIVSNSRESSSSRTDDKAELARNVEPVVATTPETVSADNSSQLFNDRIAKINEILLAISQNDVSNATGQLLDDVV